MRDRQSWLGDMTTCGEALIEQGQLIVRGARQSDPETIEAALAVAHSALDGADDLVDEAWLGEERKHGPSADIGAAAASEYHVARGGAKGAASPQRSASPRQTFAGMGSAASSKTTTAHERLRREHPEQWAIGARCGLRNKASPTEFNYWSPSERDAFFCASYLAVLRRHAQEMKAS